MRLGFRLRDIPIGLFLTKKKKKKKKKTSYVRLENQNIFLCFRHGRRTRATIVIDAIPPLFRARIEKEKVQK